MKNKNTNSQNSRKKIYKHDIKIQQSNATHKNKIANGEKAYKLLAMKNNISTNKAKELIDNGMVSIKGKRLNIARTILPINTHFDVMQDKSYIIFEDKDILAIDKSIGIESYSLEKTYQNYKLINRLDKDTSGIILMSKNDYFRQKAIDEFKQKKVQKVYFGLVEGKIYDEIIIDKKISTTKDSKAKSHINKNGLEAITKVIPIQILEQKTLVEIHILTGRTHQIRIHLTSIKHPILGDTIYNKESKIKAKRLMLHCYKTSILNYTFQSKSTIHEIFDIHN